MIVGLFFTIWSAVADSPAGSPPCMKVLKRSRERDVPVTMVSAGWFQRFVNSTSHTEELSIRLTLWVQSHSSFPHLSLEQYEEQYNHKDDLFPKQYKYRLQSTTTQRTDPHFINDGAWSIFQQVELHLPVGINHPKISDKDFFMQAAKAVDDIELIFKSEYVDGKQWYVSYFLHAFFSELSGFQIRLIPASKYYEYNQKIKRISIENAKIIDLQPL
jgi:hypothetical protein